MSATARAVAVLRAWPAGAETGVFAGRRYRVVKTVHAAGRSLKMQAWELGGPGYISLNLYDLTAGPRLCPCEMPLARVTAFLGGLRPAGQ